MDKSKKDFLLEINVEELPVGYVRPALKQLEALFSSQLDKQNIEHGDTIVGGAKNRLLLYVKEVAVKQRESSDKILGPPKRVAFGEDNKPTKQAFGFAKSQGVKIEDLKIEETAKGEYVFIEKKLKARTTKDVLKEITPFIIKDIHFPKTMKWDSSGMQFARPIRSVFLLFGNEKLDIKLGNVPNKNSASMEPSSYLKRLERTCLICPDRRKERIKNMILSSLRKLRCDETLDELLLEEVNFMVTSPYVFLGDFDKKFLSLPEEVLKASMSKYQRIFPVSKKDRLINKFIAIIDGGGRDIKSVKKNYEHILEARLKDSLFFFKEDTKMPFSEGSDRLKDLIFHKDLGNMSEKITRIEVLCSLISERLKLEDATKLDITLAARLSKMDLVTHMVGEFPSLQGVMGGVYAQKSGASKVVAQAIAEHYLPKGTDGALPKSIPGAILGISDRLDNIVGFLGTGEDFSSSFDPFGIRRNTQALIQIIKDRAFEIEIDVLIEKAIQLYKNKLRTSGPELKKRIISFIKDRIDFLSGPQHQAGLKEAVLEVECFNIVDIFKRIEALSSVKGERYFLEAAKVVERTHNILKGAGEVDIAKVRTDLFKEGLEKEVWGAYTNSRDKIKGLIDRKKYIEATREYAASFFRVLHEFFDNVMVNADDKALRDNRLGMMKAINRLYAERVADLSKLPQIVVE